MCPSVISNDPRIPQGEDAKYLECDRRLNWKILIERKQLGFQVEKTYWLLDSKSQLPAGKLPLYKATLKSILIISYGVQSWSIASNSNIEILQRFQNKYLRIIVDVPWYISNDTLHHDLNVSYVRDEIRKLSQRYDRMEKHPNKLAINLMRNAKTSRSLKRRLPQDLCTGL